MALKPMVEALDGLPEPLRPLYVERAEGDKTYYVLDVEQSGGWALENVDGLKRSLAAIRRERDEAKSAGQKAAQKWDGLGKSPDEIVAALDELAALRNAPPDEKLQRSFDAQKQALAAAHKQELEGVAAKLALRDKQIAEALVQAAAGEAIEKHRGKRALLWPILQQRLKVTEGEGGKLELQVIDPATGEARFSERAGSGGAGMTVDELVESLRKDRDLGAAFDGTDASGTGASRAGGAHGSQRKEIDLSLPAADRLRLAREQAAARGARRSA